MKINISLVIIVILFSFVVFGCTSPINKSKDYFYYYNNEKIFLNLIGERNGSLLFTARESGQKLILTDEFLVKLKHEVDAKQLELLNKKYNIQPVKNMLYTKDEFVLKVTPATKMNSLDMANIYNNEPIIQWSAPNWIREYDLNKK